MGASFKTTGTQGRVNWSPIEDVSPYIPPLDVAATGTDKKITVTWTDTDHADSHSLRYSIGAREEWTTVKTVSSPHEITGLSNGIQYSVEIGVVFGADTYWSDAAKATPFTGPDVLVVTPYDDKLHVDWDIVQKATSHTVQYKTESAQNWTTVSRPAGQGSWAWIESLTAGQVYLVRIGATVDGVTHWSSVVRATPFGLVSNVGTSSGDSELVVTWTNGSKATSHSVRYRKQPVTVWTEVTGVTSPHTLSGLENLAIYDIQVGSVAEKLTRWSPTVMDTPDEAPTNLSVTPVVRGFDLSWDLVSNADDYGMQVREVNADGTYGSWVTTSANTSPAEWRELEGTQIYEVRVGARFESGNRVRVAWSDAVEATTLDNRAPSDLALAAGDQKLTATWTATSGADSHSLRHRISVDNAWVVIANATSPAEITGLTNATAHHVQVAAVFGADVEWSDSVLGIPKESGADGMFRPMSLTANSADTSVELTWQMPDDSSQESTQSLALSSSSARAMNCGR